MRSFLMTLTAASILVADHAIAQADPDSLHLRNNCRLATEIIARGHPAPHEQWAYRIAPQCGSNAGRIIANKLIESRTSTDTAELRLLTAPAAQLHDASIFAASLEVAADKSASSVARPFAFRNLIWLISYGADLGNFDPWRSSGLGCSGAVHDRPKYAGSPLPSDFRDQVRTLAYRVAHDRSEHPAVRKSALCTIAYGGWERRNEW